MSADKAREDGLQQTLLCLTTDRDQLVAKLLATSTQAEQPGISDKDLRLCRVEGSLGHVVLELRSSSGDVQSRFGAETTTHAPNGGDDTAMVMLGYVDTARLAAVKSVVAEATVALRKDEVNDSWATAAVAKLRADQVLTDESTALRDQRKEAVQLAKAACQQQIEMLTRYNEIKDVATGLIGMIAEARQERIIDVMRTFDADPQD